MRGDAGIPELAENVEFARMAIEADHFGDEADFVVVTGVDVAHRLFVERREANGIGFALLRHEQRTAEVLKREGAAFDRRFATLDVGRREVFEVDDDRAERRVEVFFWRDIADVERQSGDLGAFFENAAIAENNDVGCRPDVFKAQQLGGQFRTYSGGVAHCQGNGRASRCCCGFAGHFGLLDKFFAESATEELGLSTI